jgi:7-cyano-7-deazaguanine tRNA-ribosyltransferase
LAEHNLYVCRAEINRIRQAIREGRLWEHVEMRAHAHPALLTALKKVRKYEEFIQKYSPASKKSGLFYFDASGLARPEVVHFKNLMRERYSPPEGAKILLLVPQTRKKPYHKAPEFRKIEQLIRHLPMGLSSRIHVCFYAAPFGVVPMELDEVYPLSQHEIAMPLSGETTDYVARQVEEYITRTNYNTVVLLHDQKNWNKHVEKSCKGAAKKKKTNFQSIALKSTESKNILARLEMILKKNSSE